MPALKSVQQSDLPYILTWANSPMELFQWSGGSLQYPLSIAQLEHYALNQSSERHQALGFIDDRGAIVGYLELSNIDKNNDSCSLSRVIVSPECRGQQIGQQMISAVVHEAFEKRHLNRISLHVFDFNERAIRCYECVGFQKEGLLRQVYKHGDNYWNVYLMSVLKSEI